MALLKGVRVTGFFVKDKIPQKQVKTLTRDIHSPIVAPMIPGDGIIRQNDTHTTWLNKMNEQIQKEETDGKDNISWSAHFASLQEAVPRPPAISATSPSLPR